MTLTEARLDEAAQRLAIESRQLSGLPLDPSTESGPQTWIQRIPSPPTALEFCRLLSRHVPVLIDGCITDRPLLKRWNNSSYLTEKMGKRKLAVTITPDGKADDIHTLSDDRDVFILPHVISITMEELLRSRLPIDHPVAYLQSQNSNLTENTDGSGDLSPLLEDLSHIDGSRQDHKYSLEWADEAMGKSPEAVNLWIGSEKSKTSMHRDHYENLFTVIRGKKIFTLYPPGEAYFLCDDVTYDVYQWIQTSLGEWLVEPSNSPPTPWIPIDPTEPASSQRNSKHSRFAKALPPLQVEVHEGETLYLPAGWYHHVSQRGDESEGICVCVNWWYESDFAFSDRWALEAFVKEVGQVVRGVD